MKSSVAARAALFPALLGAACGASGAAHACCPWVTAYLPAWEVSQNGVVPANIDLNSVTHLVWFSLVPAADGTLAEPSGEPGVNAHASAVATAAHNAGTAAVISIGGAGSEPLFNAAFRAGKTDALVASIVRWVNANSFDGVDIDDEPLAPGDASAYQTFIRKLRAALPCCMSLSAAVEPFGAARGAFTSIADQFDQINIMTYDMVYGNPLASGKGQVTWFNAPLTASTLQNGVPTVNYEQDGVTPMPSITSALANYTSAPVSIPASKLAIGAAFYGYDFSGTTGYEQAYFGAWPANAVSYGRIMTDPSLYSATYYTYDSAAGAAYVARRDTAHFITYDDPTSVAAKVNFVRSAGLGGIVCFEIGQQYMGGTNPLLQAIDTALGN